MNIFSKLTAKTMKQNKSRTVITIIGIILSTAMITAVTTLGSSFREFLLSSSRERDGNWHARVDGLSLEQMENLKRDEAVDAVSDRHSMGYVRADKAEKDPIYANILSVSKEAQRMVPVELSSGRMPENDSEILIPAYIQHHFDLHPGDTWSLLFGELQFDDMNGTVESFSPEDSREFKITGVYTQYADLSFEHPCETFLAGPAEDSAAKNSVYIRLKEPKDIYNYIKENFEEAGFSAVFNTGLLRWLGIFRGDVIYRVIYGILGILVGIIMFGSISLIYNAFSISLRERTSQFGLLSSVGATKKQLRKSLRFEAFAVSLIGIPMGILSGIAGIGITLSYIGPGLANWIHGDGSVMSLSVSWEAVALAALIAFGTVMISVWLPSRRIRKVSPMEAIRANRDIRVNTGKVRTGRLVGWIFGLEGTLASKNYSRDSKKYRSTVISLTTSMVLFVSASLFLSYMLDASGIALSTANTDILLHVDEGGVKRIREIVEAEPLVDSWTEYREEMRYVSGGQISSDLLYQNEDENGWRGYGVDCILLSDKDFLEYAARTKVDGEACLESEELTGILYDTVDFYDGGEQKYRRSLAFQKELPKELTLYQIKEWEEGESWEARSVGKTRLKARADVLPESVDSESSFEACLIFPERSWMRLGMKTEAENRYAERIGIRAQDYRGAARKLRENIAAAGLGDSVYILEPRVKTETNRNTYMAILVLAYGFIILLALIAAVNVFNTVSTNLMLRRKEFAMLRSVGMTNKGFRKMQGYECLLYGGRATLYGCIFSAGVSYLIYLVLNQGVGVAFRMPWGYMLAGAAGIFLVVFTAMFCTMRKIRKQNIVEELKMD